LAADCAERLFVAESQRGAGQARKGHGMERFRVATTQLHVRHMDVERNLDAHLKFIDQAGDAACDLVVFPELSATGHNGTPEVTRAAEPSDGPIYQTIFDRVRGRGIVVAYGFCELFRGTHYNAYALVGPDGMIGIQRKVHASFDEFFRFRQAYEWSVFDLGFCQIGTAICHDSDFFESWRILNLKGAEVVLLPHANRKMFGSDGTMTFDGSEREASTEELLRFQEELTKERPHPPRLHDVLARDNGVFAIFSDQVGFDGDSTHVGGAYVLAPDGSMLTRTQVGLESSMVWVDLDPGILRKVRENPVFALLKRRPETYTELTVPL
jgi:predicted amidohydrolase